MDRLPIVLLTGFLGAGKTTLLNALLRTPQMRDTAVLVNEYGEVGIDQALIQLSGAEVILLDNGCICCSIREGLAATLLDLIDKRDRGEVPAFQRVVIEASGLASPFPIIHLVVDDAQVAQRYGMQLLLTVVDAKHALVWLDSRAEAVDQVVAADAIWISKTDLAPAGQQAETRLRIGSLNRGATLLSADRQTDWNELLQACAEDLHEPSLQPRLGWRRLARLDHGLDCSCCARSPLLPGVPGHSIVSCCVIRSAPLRWDVVGSWLEDIMQTLDGQLLRIKGIVCIEGDEARPWVIHGVQDWLSAPEPMAAWPSGDRVSKVVFIGRALEHDDLDARLSALEAAQ